MLQISFFWQGPRQTTEYLQVRSSTNVFTSVVFQTPLAIYTMQKKKLHSFSMIGLLAHDLFRYLLSEICIPPEMYSNPRCHVTILMEVDTISTNLKIDLKFKSETIMSCQKV